KDLLGQRFHLEAHLVADAPGAAQAVAMFTADPITQEATVFGKNIVPARGDFCQKSVVVFVGEDVTAACDAHAQFVIIAAHAALGENLEQFGMERSAIKLKDEIRNQRTQ